MKIKGTWSGKSHTYGYCACGREVIKDKDVKCPLCGAKLEWSEEDQKGVKNNE